MKNGIKFLGGCKEREKGIRITVRVAEMDGSRTEIRSCREKDLDEVCAIEKRNFPSPNTRWWFERILFQKSKALFLVAVEGEDVLGFAVAVIERDLRLREFRFDKYAHLMKVAVRENRRREGIGTTLLQELSKRMKDRGINCIKLEVRSQNIGARKFYRSLGFVKEDFVENYYPNDDDALKMRKDLTSGENETS